MAIINNPTSAGVLNYNVTEVTYNEVATPLLNVIGTYKFGNYTYTLTTLDTDNSEYVIAFFLHEPKKNQLTYKGLFDCSTRVSDSALITYDYITYVNYTSAGLEFVFIESSDTNRYASIKFDILTSANGYTIRNIVTRNRYEKDASGYIAMFERLGYKLSDGYTYESKLGTNYATLYFLVLFSDEETKTEYYSIKSYNLISGIVSTVIENFDEFCENNIGANLRGIGDYLLINHPSGLVMIANYNDVSYIGNLNRKLVSVVNQSIDADSKTKFVLYTDSIYYSTADYLVSTSSTDYSVTMVFMYKVGAATFVITPVSGSYSSGTSTKDYVVYDSSLVINNNGNMQILQFTQPASTAGASPRGGIEAIEKPTVFPTYIGNVSYLTDFRTYSAYLTYVSYVSSFVTA